MILYYNAKILYLRCFNNFKCYLAEPHAKQRDGTLPFGDGPSGRRPNHFWRWRSPVLCRIQQVIVLQCHAAEIFWNGDGGRPRARVPNGAKMSRDCGV